MAITFPIASAHLSALEAVSPGSFFYRLVAGTSKCELCVGFQLPAPDPNRRAFVRLSGDDRFRIATTNLISSASVILLPPLNLSFNLGDEKAQGEKLGRGGNLSFSAAGPVLSAYASTGDSCVSIDLRTWTALVENPDFDASFADWQLLHTAADGVDRPIVSKGSFES